MADHSIAIPPEGSLALLAAGHTALRAWRVARGPDWAASLKPLSAPDGASGEPPTRAASREVPSADVLSRLRLVVVSGLPRSGTSMMMQMLVAGGAEAYTDTHRAPDESNPRGYYEHEAVTRLQRDARWLADADGKAVKVVAPLLEALPVGPSYTVVFMDRDLDAVVRSQAAMLGHAGAPPADLAQSFRRFQRQSLDWAERTSGAHLLRLDYAEVLARPRDVADRVAGFIGEHALLALEPERMAAAVDPSLHRHLPR